MQLFTSILFSGVVVSSSLSSTYALETNPQECLPDFDASIDYFPDKFVPDETTDLLSITYHKTYKIVTNKYHNKSYLLYQCGTKPPADEVDSGKHHLVLPIPHQGGLVITETPQIPPPELLGRRRDIRAYIGNPKFISSPCLKYMKDEFLLQVIFFPEDPWNASEEATAEYLEENPYAIVFTGPLDDSDGERQMGVAASQERTAVATFDWIGMYAALYNLEGMANQIVADTKARYECSASNAAALTTDLPAEDKATVLWAQYFDGYGWSVAECPTWDAAYYCEYAQHCGANLLSRPEGMGTSQDFGGSTLYWYLSDEELLELGKDAEYWIYASKTFQDVYEAKKELMDQFRAVQNRQVYDTQGQGEHAWHEQRLAEYDVVALDMCDIVGTSNPNPPLHKRRWFRNLYTEAVGYLPECKAPTEVDEPYVPAEAQCFPLEGGGNSGGNDTSTASSNRALSLPNVLGITIIVLLIAATTN